MRRTVPLSCLLIVAAITTVGVLPNSALSAEKKHETAKVHGMEGPPDNIKYWEEASIWTTKPPSVVSVPDDPNTQTDWVFSTPADLTANMFHHVLMDESMATVADYTQDDLTLMEMRFNRSQAGAPPSLLLTLQHDRFVGNGWEVRRGSPIDVPMIRTGFQATPIPGEYLAIYSGMVPIGAHWQVFDQALGLDFIDLFSDEEQPIEIAVLTTSVPEPSSLALLAGCGVALALAGRRRVRSRLPAIKSAAVVLAAVVAVSMTGNTAEAKPKTIHWTTRDHFTDSWFEFKNWREVNERHHKYLSPGVPNTITWDNFEAAAPEMIHYTLMDDMMNTVSEFDQTDLASVEMTFIYSSDEAPPTMDFTVLEEHYLTDVGIERHLVDPLQMTMTRVSIGPGSTPGTLFAVYEAIVPAGQRWSTLDPALGPTPVISTTDEPYVYELGIEVAIPEPASISLAALGYLALTFRRRRRVK